MKIKEIYEKIKSGEIDKKLDEAEKDLTKYLEIVRTLKELAIEVRKVSGSAGGIIDMMFKK